MLRLLCALLLATAADAGMLVIATPLPEERNEVAARLDNAARDILGWPYMMPGVEHYGVRYTDGTYEYSVPGNGDPRLTRDVVWRFSVACPTLGVTYRDSIPENWTPVSDGLGE